MRWCLVLWLLLPLLSCNKSQPSKSSSDSNEIYEKSNSPPKHRLNCGGGSRSSEQETSDSFDSRSRDTDKCQCTLKAKGKNQQHMNKLGNSAAKGPSNSECCMRCLTETLENGGTSPFKVVKTLEETLVETDLDETTSLFAGRFVAFLHKPKGPFKGLSVYASDREANSERAVLNNKVHVEFPRELDAESNNIVVFCMVSLPQMNKTTLGSEVLYENRLIGLSVRGKRVSSLQEPVNITLNLNTSINSMVVPKCVFLNFTTNNFSEDGCVTHWTNHHVICSCNHFTYFGVLMVSPDIRSEDQVNLSYITMIGCSISLFALFITLVLFFTKRTIRTDTSMKVHINLAIALILLNVHLLPSEVVATRSSESLCFYMALLLHYSLLATFIWMGLEGFHLYLLLVKVFNIYIRKYILKLSLVGWGVPAVIVAIVIAIDRNVYGRTLVNPLNSNSTEMCYINNYTVKMLTTVGLFCMVFIFNFIMFILIVRRVLIIHHGKEYGQKHSGRVKYEVCTLLGISILLGTTWGLIFFSFDDLPIAGLYAFCILNSLQGFFIFIWFMLSLRKTGNTATKTSSETHTSHG